MGETLDPGRGYLKSSMPHQKIAGITQSTSEAIFCIQDTRIESLQDRALFDQIYEKNISNGTWKSRGDSEKDILFQSYRVLVGRGEILGGYSLRDFSLGTNRGKLIECLWVKYTGRGIGKHMIGLIFSDLNEGENLFAYSAQYDFFIKSGFSLVPGEISSTGNPLFMRKKD